ncbi:MAG: MBL fold metallo-hydrolase, partial [Proteobacteria bacterium]
IVLSHLDFDHAGGLDDFPGAKVHMLTAEASYAKEQKTWLDRQRFRPQQWSYPLQWKTYEAGEGESWNDFNTVRQLEGLPPEILLIPLIGHTFGHAGVAVQKDNNQWLFYTGDAYFYHKEMNVDSPECTPGLELYQTMMEKNRKSRLWNQTRLRELKKTKGDAIEIFCAHDLVEFERLAGQPYNNPVRQMQRPSSSDHASYLS